MKKVIVLMVEGEPVLFSTEKRMVEFLNEQDGDMSRQKLDTLLTDHEVSTAHAWYCWGWYEIS